MPARKTQDVEPTVSESVQEFPAQIETYPPIEIPSPPTATGSTAYERPGVYGAMVAAQSEIGNIAKTALNPHFKSKFVDLATASEHILPILNKHGLFVIQGVDYRGDTPLLNTTIYHEDGSSIGGYSYPLVTKDANNPQALGASMTYARRYSLMAIVGAAPEDDDGNKAATPPKKQETNKDALKKHLVTTKADSAAFKKMASSAGVSAEKFADLSEEDARKMLAALDNQVPF